MHIVESEYSRNNTYGNSHSMYSYRENKNFRNEHNPNRGDKKNGEWSNFEQSNHHAAMMVNNNRIARYSDKTQ